MKVDATEIILEDPHVIGFLLLPRYNFTVSYNLNWSQRIAATVKGDPTELKQAFADLQGNLAVGSRDLIESIKSVRTQIFQTKSKLRDGK